MLRSWISFELNVRIGSSPDSLPSSSFRPATASRNFVGLREGFNRHVDRLTKLLDAVFPSILLVKWSKHGRTRYPLGKSVFAKIAATTVNFISRETSILTIVDPGIE